MSDVFPSVTILGADALLAFLTQGSGGTLTPHRARRHDIAYSTLKSLETRKLIELEWTTRREPKWAMAKLTELGRAYAVVLQTQKEQTRSVRETLENIDASRASWRDRGQ